MFEQWFDNLRKASESSLQGQQLLKQWMQHWPSVPPAAPSGDTYWSAFAQKGLTDALNESLTRYRELLDSTYRTGVQVIQQALRVSEVKSVEDYKRYTEELWRKLTDTLGQQVEAQLRELNKLAERWRDVTHRTEP
jgi:hypothetical protein